MSFYEIQCIKGSAVFLDFFVLSLSILVKNLKAMEGTEGRLQFDYLLSTIKL